MLEADELLIVGGKLVGEFFPPSLLGGVLGQREQERAPRPGDLVVVEEPLDLPWLQAGPGPLISADLGRRPFQRGGDGVPALALALPDLAQLRGQPAPPHRGAGRLGHPASLLPGAARAGSVWARTSILEAMMKLSHTSRPDPCPAGRLDCRDARLRAGRVVGSRCRAGMKRREGGGGEARGTAAAAVSRNAN